MTQSQLILTNNFYPSSEFMLVNSSTFIDHLLWDNVTQKVVKISLIAPSSKLSKGETLVR